MAYQIPALVDALILGQVDSIPLYNFSPIADVKLQHIIVTIFLRDMVGQGWSLKCCVYYDSARLKKAFESSTVSNSDIDRDGNTDFYCEQRFDFPLAGNNLVIGKTYYVDIELFGAYSPSANNYLGLIIDHDSILAINSVGTNVIRHSAFYGVIER